MAQPTPDLEAGLPCKEVSIESPISPRTTITLCSGGSVLSNSAAQDSINANKRQNPWTSGLTSFLSWLHLATPHPAPNAKSTPANGPSPVRKLKSCRPGFPRLAAFQDSDENFMIYRRFGYVFSRLLLHKQNRLQKLETSLDELDQSEGDEDEDYLKYTDWATDEDSSRSRLFRDLEKATREYAELIGLAKEMVATSRPSNFEYRSIHDYVDDTRPLCEDDTPALRLQEDLITLRPGREHAWLDELIEYCLRTFHCKALHNLFCSETTRQKADDDDKVIYYTRSRINLLASAIITFAILALLIGPIYILYRLTATVKQPPHATAACIGTLLVSTLAFSAVLAFFTRARRHEILGAAAAYCAVLVVFLSNVPMASRLPGS